MDVIQIWKNQMRSKAYRISSESVKAMEQISKTHENLSIFWDNQMKKWGFFFFFFS